MRAGSRLSSDYVPRPRGGLRYLPIAIGHRGLIAYRPLGPSGPGGPKQAPHGS
jgi:hypothetical protein